MAAVLARGETVIDNAAREPEIVDICPMLQEMGARIDGVGTSTLTIEGVDALHPVEHATVPDRIVAGTWAVAAAMTRGDITIRNADAGHLSIALEKLAIAGAQVDVLDDGFRVVMDARPKAVDIVTLPYPGFPTDLQPQFIALNSIAEGAALVTENLFEARFRFVQELARLGADVRTDGHHALVRGRSTPVGRARGGDGHPGRRRARAGRPRGRGADHRLRRRPHRPRLCGLRPGPAVARRGRRPRRGQRPLASSSRARASSLGQTISRGPSMVVARLARTPLSSSRRRSISPSMYVGGDATGTRSPYS